MLPAVPGITTQVEKMSVASQRLQDYFDRTRARLMFGEGEGEGGMGGLEGTQRGDGALEDAQLAEWRRWGDVFFEVQHREVLLNTLQVRGEDEGGIAWSIVPVGSSLACSSSWPLHESSRGPLV